MVAVRSNLLCLMLLVQIFSEILDLYLRIIRFNHVLWTKWMINWGNPLFMIVMNYMTLGSRFTFSLLHSKSMSLGVRSSFFMSHVSLNWTLRRLRVRKYSSEPHVFFGKCKVQECPRIHSSKWDIVFDFEKHEVLMVRVGLWKCKFDNRILPSKYVFEVRVWSVKHEIVVSLHIFLRKHDLALKIHVSIWNTRLNFSCVFVT